MTRTELNERNNKIIKYKLEGHTYENTKEYTSKNFKISSLSQIFNIMRKYKESIKEGETKT